jgi:hypothetical protein
LEPRLISLLGADVPIVLGLAIQNSEVLLRDANAFLLLFHLVGFTAFLVRGRRSGVELSHKVMLAIFILTVFVQLASLFNFVTHHQLAFSFGLIYGIFVAVQNFYLLLFYSGEGAA